MHMGGPILQKNLLYGGNFLLESYLKGEHVLKVDMSKGGCFSG